MTNSYIFASGAAMPCARWVFSPCGRQAERGYFHRGTSATGKGLEPTAPCRARGRRSRGRERPAGGGRRRRRCGGEELGRLAPARASPHACRPHGAGAEAGRAHEVRAGHDGPRPARFLGPRHAGDAAPRHRRDGGGPRRRRRRDAAPPGAGVRRELRGFQARHGPDRARAPAAACRAAGPDRRRAARERGALSRHLRPRRGGDRPARPRRALAAREPEAVRDPRLPARGARDAELHRPHSAGRARRRDGIQRAHDPRRGLHLFAREALSAQGRQHRLGEPRGERGEGRRRQAEPRHLGDPGHLRPQGGRGEAAKERGALPQPDHDVLGLLLGDRPGAPPAPAGARRRLPAHLLAAGPARQGLVGPAEHPARCRGLGRAQGDSRRAPAVPRFPLRAHRLRGHRAPANIGYRGVGTDVTERRRVEASQVAHTRHQEIIAEFGRSALRLHDPQALLDDAVSGAAHALGAETLAFFECVADERKVVLRACSGRTLDASIVEIGADDVIGGSIRSGEPCALQDGQAVQAGFPGGWAQGFAAALVTPVRGERRTFGLLCAFSPRPRAYAEAETGFLGALASVLSAALQRINSEERLAYLAQFDNLTGLPNRALMRDRFAQMLAHSSRHGSKLGVMFVDLDHFKLVNDMQGHAAGDELLKEVARRLAACVRSGDTVARISGDEFVIILGDLASAESAPPVAQKVLERLAAPFSLSGRETFVTASIGMAIYPDDGDSADALISAADAAMYRAKESGRNSYCSFTPGIAEGARARLQLAAELRRALEREEFRMVYQPKVALGTRVVRGAEALLRWAHPERGLVPPGEFVPVLEETGLIVAVGDWVLRRGGADNRAWAPGGGSAAGWWGGRAPRAGRGRGGGGSRCRSRSTCRRGSSRAATSTARSATS